MGAFCKDESYSDKSTSVVIIYNIEYLFQKSFVLSFPKMLYKGIINQKYWNETLIFFVGAYIMGEGLYLKGNLC